MTNIRDIKLLNFQLAWENWCVKRRFKNYKLMKSASDSEKRLIIHRAVILNNFLLRRNVDLAFRNLVYLRLQKNKKLFLKIKKVFLKILSDVVMDDDEVKEILEKGEFKYEMLFPTDSEEEISRKIRERNKISQIFFDHLINKKMQNKDLESVSILITLKQEFQTGRFTPNKIFSSLDPYSENSQMRKYNFFANRFAISNIDNYQLYINFGKLTPAFHRYLNQLSELLSKDFTNKIINIVFEILEVEKSLENISKYIKLIKDLLAIASELYFTSLSLEDQVKFLNLRCNLEQLINEYLKSNPSIEKYEWTIISLALRFNGFHNLALKMFLIYFNRHNKIDLSYKYYLLDSIATFYKLSKNYSKALEYYLKAHQMVEKSCDWNYQINPFDYHELISQKNHDIIPPDYKKAISLKNVGECYGQVGQKEKMICFFNQVKKIAEDIKPIKFKTLINWNLACAYRRLQNFNQERETLNLLIDHLEFFNETINSIIEERIDAFFKTNMDYAKLEKLEILTEFNNLMEYGINAQISLNLKQSILFFKNAVKISKTLGITERLKVFKGLGFSYLYLSDWSSAIKVFKYILSFEKDDLETIGVICCLYSKLGDDLKSVRWTIDFLQQVAINIDQFKDLMDDWILRMLNLLGENKFKDLLIQVEKANFKNKDVALVYLSNYIANHGFFNLGIYLIKEATALSTDDKVKAMCFSNLGIIYANRDDHKKAIEIYKKAIKLDNENPFYYQNKSSSYIHMLDYLKALKLIDKALEISKRKYLYNLIPELESKKVRIEKLSKDILNVNKVSEKVRSSLISAEIIFRDYQRRGTLPDASSIAIGYAKSLEIILDERLSIYLKSFMKNKYSNTYIKNQDIWKKFGNLLSDKSIFLGSWIRIIEDINKPSISFDLIPFKKILKTRVSDEILEIIREGCELLINARNPGAHNVILAMDDMINLRSNIISKLNKIIDALY